MTASALAYYAGGIALGLVLGAAFSALWRVCVPPGATGRMASEQFAIAKEMTRTEETAAFFALYKRLIVSVGGYLLRSLGGLVLACLPMVLVLTLLVPPALEGWGRRADATATYPPLPIAAGAAALSIGGVEVPVPSPNGRFAVCWNGTYCALFVLLGFDVHEAPDALLANRSYVVVRPTHGDGNFLWPFLSDLEFASFLAFVVATAGGLVWPRRRRRE